MLSLRSYFGYLKPGNSIISTSWSGCATLPKTEQHPCRLLRHPHPSPSCVVSAAGESHVVCASTARILSLAPVSSRERFTFGSRRNWVDIICFRWSASAEVVTIATHWAATRHQLSFKPNSRSLKYLCIPGICHGNFTTVESVSKLQDALQVGWEAIMKLSNTRWRCYDKPEYKWQASVQFADILQFRKVVCHLQSSFLLSTGI